MRSNLKHNFYPSAVPALFPVGVHTRRGVSFFEVLLMALRDQPYLPLYVQDFMTDEKLVECSAASTGVYIRLMCILHKSKTYGCVLLKQKYKQNGSTCLNFACQFAKSMPYQIKTIENAINELYSEDVIQIEGDKLMQKRMIKDNSISIARSKAGKKGGKKTQFAKAKVKANTQAKVKANSEYEYEGEYVNENINANDIGKWIQIALSEYEKMIGRYPHNIIPVKKYDRIQEALNVAGSVDDLIDRWKYYLKDNGDRSKAAETGWSIEFFLGTHGKYANGEVNKTTSRQPAIPQEPGAEQAEWERTKWKRK